MAAALRETLARYGLSADPLQALIDAHTFDLYDAPMASLQDFDDYASAHPRRGVRGGRRDPRRPDAGNAALSRHAGIAYTVAGVLTNLPLNAARRQLYLPQELLGRHGVVPEAVFARENSEGLRAALADLRAHAREHLAAAQRRCKACRLALPALLPVAPSAHARRMEHRAPTVRPQPLSLSIGNGCLARRAAPKRFSGPNRAARATNSAVIVRESGRSS